MKYKIYIYGLHQNGKLIYVGKTNSPKNRLVSHRQTYGDNLHMVILDIYNDLEMVWVEKLQEEGHKLFNKEDLYSNRDSSYEIGDKIALDENYRKGISIRDTELDIVYPSALEFEKATGIEGQTILYQLREAKEVKEIYQKYKLEKY